MPSGAAGRHGDKSGDSFSCSDCPIDAGYFLPFPDPVLNPC
jgi:hypothetical protein